MEHRSFVFPFSPCVLLCTLMLTLLFFPAQAKKRCKPLLEKLHNVQAMQRNSYSSKRGNSLRAREDKARDKWWQCEHSSRFVKSDSSKKKKKATSYKRKAVPKSNTYYSYRKTGVVSPPFVDNNEIIIKSKYQGSKKFAWLAFYQQPSQCQRPKNLAIFAACSEDKQSQQLTFEQQYLELKVN